MSDKDVFGISADNVDIGVDLPVVDTKSDAECVLEFMSLSKEDREVRLREIEARRKSLCDVDKKSVRSDWKRSSCLGHLYKKV